MKRLEKMLLINWHYIRHQLLEFKDVNFLTGKNGAGKSTIIDALQLMMLGDTAGHFFNKAASERSNRSLKGYLRGEVAEDEESNTIYLRDGKDFTSYLVLEFVDTVSGNRFCLGAAFDSYKDGESKHRFFYLKDALPPHHFHFDNALMNIAALRAWLSNHYGNKRCQVFDSNAEYRQVMRGVLGNLNERFLKLFKKAVPFSPITNIKHFITEFVCDTENEVDITHMQENIRQYKQLEEELDWVEKRVGSLEQIGTQYAAYSEESNRLFIQQYLLDRAAMAKSEDDFDAQHKEISALADRISLLTEEIDDDTETLRKLTAKRDDLVEERARSDIYQKEQALTEKKRIIKTELHEAQNSKERLLTLLNGHYRSWQEIVLWCSEHLELQPSKTEMMAALALLDAGSEETSSLDHHSLTALKAQLDSYHATLQKNYYDLEREQKELQQQAHQLRTEIAGLRQGIKPYDQTLLILKRTIEDECGEKANPQIFADLLEIKNRKWEKAVEGYLHTQKFYLLVEPRFFTQALKIYDRLKHEHKFYDLGLVDMEKVMQQKPSAMPGSLAEEVETENILARAYADFLLGRVMKCDNVDELRRHRTAITPDGMLYQKYVARQIHPRRYENPYIGRKSLARLIAQKEKQQSAVSDRLNGLTPLVAELSRMRTVPVLSQNDIDHILTLKTKVTAIPALTEKLCAVVDELGTLDLSYLVTLDQNIKACEKEMKATQNRLDVRREDRGKAVNQKSSRETLLPVLEQQKKQLAAQLVAQYDMKWSEETGEARFHAELKSRGTAAAIITAFTSVVKGTETKKKDKWDVLVEVRSHYNRDFKGSFSPTSPDNTAYDHELSRLRDTLLLDYREKIQVAKERAQEQFREDFISKLRANIERVEEQIKDLNRAIKDNFFGRDRYRFTVTPSPSYRRFYEMITDDMLIEGFNLFSGTFIEKHGDTVEELFRQIVDIGEGALTADQRQQLAENLQRFTDYRIYLDFDMVNIDDEGRESRLSRVLNKKSGGETQTPFYIAVLASFLQLYRVRQGDEDTLRLIVFDEAYSKMDHQRIQESVRLVRELGLQLILSAPTEKIGDIAPLMDRNLCVIRVKRETVIKGFDPQQLQEMGA